MTAIIDRLPAGAEMPRHAHAKSYVTFVVRGDYVEAGDQGRFHVQPGDVVVHTRFSSHANWIGMRSDVETLNIELDTSPDLPALFTSANFDKAIALAQSDPLLAIKEAFTSFLPKTELSTDWPDQIAQSIRADPVSPVNHWCQVFDLAPATVSRGFRRTFGVSAAQYRATARARYAYRLLLEGNEGLADLAHLCGFSDQAHLTRAIRALTGVTPSCLRNVKNLQDKELLPN